LSSFVQEPDGALVRRLEELATLHPATMREAERQHPNEPWRQLAVLMRAHLPRAKTIAAEPARVTAAVKDKSQVPPDDDRRDAAVRYYEDAGLLLSDVRLLRESLVKVGAIRLAEADVDPMIRRVSSIGFHLAGLDVRQNSQYHDAALSQLLVAAGVEDAATWADWSEERRLELLNRELQSPRPFARFGRRIGQESDELLATYRVLARHAEHHGTRGLGALIVSMTRQLSDLLTV